MGVFKSERFFKANSSLISGIARKIEEDFKHEGFEVQIINLVSGGADLSLSKGGVFKAIVGMKSALKITMLPKDGGFEFRAGVGVFGQQVVPSLLTWFVAWPVLIAQIWGMVRQSKLDDRAIAIAEHYISEHPEGGPIVSERGVSGLGFCTACGKPVVQGAAFCAYCGVRFGE